MIESDLYVRVRICLTDSALRALNNNLSSRQHIVLAINSIYQHVPQIGLKGLYGEPRDEKYKIVGYINLFV